ncbi:hypothetical protein ATORI0001_0091 [Lancefieldella rimae ATCC 49626]|uniref:Uncharacterized protein n=1 Tax=Lancefieldella rimae (strain ATCC 49626 / DSM 7090 / CCUG 31168 / NBRC 15546 / VPI D140H-11A) TaxID=553184 RepID=B9CNP2_LANR4|nr:hypothetical protein ATORI0001_0091 [Lancefieldella rimae ATCC 49626]
MPASCLSRSPQAAFPKRQDVVLLALSLAALFTILNSL